MADVTRSCPAKLSGTAQPGHLLSESLNSMSAPACTHCLKSILSPNLIPRGALHLVGVICVHVGLYGLAPRVTVAGSAFLCPDTQADGAYREL
jgi:hypothetical protein